MPQNALRQRNGRRLSAGIPRTTVHQYQTEITIAAKRSTLGIGQQVSAVKAGLKIPVYRSQSDPHSSYFCHQLLVQSNRPSLFGVIFFIDLSQILSKILGPLLDPFREAL